MKRYFYELRPFNTDLDKTETFSGEVLGRFSSELEAFRAADKIELYGKIFVFEEDEEDENHCELYDVLDVFKV